MKQYAEITLRIVCLAYLLLCCRSDLRFRRIHTAPALILTAAGIAVSLSAGIYAPQEVFLILAGSAFLFAVSFISHSSFGTGDCLVIMSCGSLTGFAPASASLMVSFLICGAFSSVLLISKKATRKDTLPFLPFLLAGHVIVLLSEVFHL